jgi:HSP20 family molecular chaperone IbpA
MVALPDTVDVEKITATFRHGLLELMLPLKEAVKPRRIEIPTEDPKQLAPAA